MNAVAGFDLDREYYESFYAAWIKYRSRWRRFAMPLWTIVLLCAVAALLLLPSLWQISGIVAIVAVVSLFVPRSAFESEADYQSAINSLGNASAKT